METDDYVGARVRISTEDGTYEGNIHLADLYNKKLSLERVVVANTGKRLQGLQNFYGNELESLDFLEESPLIKPKQAENSLREKGQSILDKGHKYTPPHLKNLRRRDEGVPVETSSGEEEAARPNTPGTTKSGYDSGIDQEAAQKGRTRFAFTVLDKIGEQVFSDALSHITEHSVVGLAVEGIEIGRDGELCWLQIATPDHVFLFDIKTMGHLCFSKGLKDVLENEHILKVMHNCRLPSDMLFHKYGVNLVNIFDTQVADVFVYRNSHGGDWPRYVQDLAIVLLDHLGLSAADVYIRRVRKGCVQEDSAFWAERPALGRVLDAAVKDVVYLRELRRVLMEKMMMEYTAGVDIFLSCVRDAVSTEAQKMKESSHLLPVTFTNLPQHFYQPKFKARPHRIEKDPNGFVENIRTFDSSLFADREGTSSVEKPELAPKSDPVAGDCGNREQLQAEPLLINSSPEGLTGKLAQGEGVAKRQDLPGAKISAGRGSIISCDNAEVTPGAGQHQSPEPVRTSPHQLDNPDSSQTKPAPSDSLESNESYCGHIPVWTDLIQPETSDLKGLILKPAGVHEKLKKASERPNSTWPDGKRVYQNLVQSYSDDAETFENSEPSPTLTSTEVLEKNCFDAIPSRRSQTKSIGHKVEPFLDFGCVDDVGMSVPVREAGEPLSCPDNLVINEPSVLRKVSSGTVPYGSKVGRTRFSEPSPMANYNAGMPYPYVAEGHDGPMLDSQHCPGYYRHLGKAASQGTSSYSLSDQHGGTEQVCGGNTENPQDKFHNRSVPDGAQGKGSMAVSQSSDKVTLSEPSREPPGTSTGTAGQPQNSLSKLQLLLQLVESGNQPAPTTDEGLIKF